MGATNATLIFAIGIFGLFLLNRDAEARTSKALWIPVVWLLIVGSRPVSIWLQIAPQTQSPEQYLDGSPVDRFVFAVLLVVGLIVLFRRRRQVGELLGKNGPTILFFAYCAVSVLWSDFPDVAIKRWVKAVGDLVMVLLVLTDSEPAAALKRLLARTGFLLLPISLLLIKYYPNLGWGYEPWSWTPIYTGVTTNKNSLGVTALLFGLGAVWRIFDLLGSKDASHRRRHLIAHGALLVIVTWLLVIAHSGTSLSCFVFGSILIAGTSLRAVNQKRAVVHLLVATIVSISFFALFIDARGGLIETLGKDPTLTGRTEIWHHVLDMPVNRLFGTGFESFWLGDRLHKMWDIYWWHPNEAHDGYIEILLNLGWIGVGLLGILLATGYRHVLAALRRADRSGGLKLAYFVIAVVYNFTESAFKELSPVWIFFLLATIAIPSTSAPEVSVAIDRSESFFAYNSQVDQVVPVGLRRRII